MAYTKQIWENSPSTNTPLSADRLNHMEDGIDNAYKQIKNTYDTSTTDSYSCNYVNNNFQNSYNLITNGSAVKTGRKIDGKDEYIKRIECDNLGASGVEKEYATGIDVPNSIITDINVIGHAGSNNYFPFPNNDAGNSKTVLKYTGNLGITIFNGYWENGTAYAEIKYIAK